MCNFYERDMVLISFKDQIYCPFSNCLLFLNGRIYSCPHLSLSSTPNGPVSPRNDFTIYLTETVELIKHELILNPYPDKSILQIHSFSLFQNPKEGLPIPGCCSLYLISME